MKAGKGTISDTNWEPAESRGTDTFLAESRSVQPGVVDNPAENLAAIAAGRFHEQSHLGHTWHFHDPFVRRAVRDRNP